MPAPQPSRPPKQPTPTPTRAPESDADRRARHLDMLREMAELAMAVARDAAAKATSPDPAPPDAPDPGLTFSRATRAARPAIALEPRIAAGHLPGHRPPRPAAEARPVHLMLATREPIRRPPRGRHPSRSRPSDDGIVNRSRALGGCRTTR